MLVGRAWRDRWEDGEEGIWRASDTCDVVVAKAAELNDPALCDASTAGSIWNRAAIKILGNSQLSLAKDSALTTATTPEGVPLSNYAGCHGTPAGSPWWRHQSFCAGPSPGAS